jgi:endonuclease/exonuclease/phosphatase family metal-dependent hydrolase
MRFAVYNQMFGLDGRSFWGSVVGHWAVHYQSRKDRIKRRVDLNATLKLIGRSRADVVGICEVLEGQEDFLEKGLNMMGYRYVFFAEGHKTKFGHLGVRVCLASKIKCKHVKVEKVPFSNRFGGGGGMINCYFQKPRMNVVVTHLACRPDLRDRQIARLQGHFKNKKIVFMGDFNTCYDNVRHHFGDFNLVTGRVETCSMTPVIRWFVWRDFDHILERGFRKKSVGSFEGRSDHKLLYADLE